jgi:hypothetical protein
MNECIVRKNIENKQKEWLMRKKKKIVSDSDPDRESGSGSKKAGMQKRPTKKKKVKKCCVKCWVVSLGSWRLFLPTAL